MSDSSFFEFQRLAQEKMNKATSDLNEEMLENAIRERFKRNTKPVKKTLWQKIKGWFSE